VHGTPPQTFNATNAAVASFPAVSQLLPVTKVPPAAAGSKRSAATVTARQFEVQAAFTLLPPGHGTGGTRSGVTAEASGGRRNSSIVKQADEFAAGVRIELGSGRFADVYLKGTVRSLAPASPRYAISSLSIWVDRANAGGATNTTFMEGGPVPTPVDSSQAWLAPDQPLNLSIWVSVRMYVFGARRGGWWLQQSALRPPWVVGAVEGRLVTDTRLAHLCPCWTHRWTTA
jgi:hypothetical protein